MISSNEAVIPAVQIDAPICAQPRIDWVTRDRNSNSRWKVAAQVGLAARAFQRDHEAPM